MTTSTSPEFATRGGHFAASNMPVQQVQHYLMLRQANAGQYDDDSFELGIASCKNFLERGVTFHPGSLHYSSTDEVTIGDVRQDMPTCILGCMLENAWRPERAATLSEIFRLYHASGHFDADAMVSPPIKCAAPRAEIPAVEAAALTKRFDQMFLLLELGAPVVRDDGYDLLSTLDILNIPNRAEIGVRINHIVMARQIAVATSTAPDPAPEPEDRPTARRRIRV